MTGKDRAEELRLAQNEALFRRVNEALEPDDAAADEVIRFVCECGTLGCTETVALTQAEYEAVRTAFNRFLLVPGHEDEVDVVLAHHGHFTVVAKVGEAAEVAAQLDPRGGGQEQPR